MWIKITMALTVVGLASTVIMRFTQKGTAVAEAHALAVRFSAWVGFLICAFFAAALLIVMQPNVSRGNAMLVMSLAGLPLTGIAIFGVLMPILFWSRLCWTHSNGIDSKAERAAP